MTRSLADVIEPLYRGLDSPRWLELVRDSIRDWMGPGTEGVGVFEVAAGKGRFELQGVSLDPGLEQALNHIAGGAHLPLLRAFYRRIPRSLIDEWLLRGSTSTLRASLDRAAPPLARLAARAPDAINSVGLDPSGRGIVVTISSGERTAAARSEELALLAAHLASAARLRGSAPCGEAVVTHDEVLHAEGEARLARHELRAAARRIDRARSRASPEDALGRAQLWTALVEGRWTLLEQFDSDGRRFFVARRNDPAHRKQLALTERERKIVAMLALGRAQKYIAYELGFSEAAVSHAVRRAMRKLGVATRAQLVDLHGRLVSSEPR